jgi:hypothetical protein
MSEQSKFSGALSRLKVRPAPEQDANEPANVPATHTPVMERGKGRPPGKRSDPDYQPTTVLLRKQTKRAANRLLQDADDGQDLSDLIEQLLTEWIKRS